VSVQFVNQFLFSAGKTILFYGLQKRSFITVSLLLMIPTNALHTG